MAWAWSGSGMTGWDVVWLGRGWVRLGWGEVRSHLVRGPRALSLLPVISLVTLVLPCVAAGHPHELFAAFLGCGNILPLHRPLLRPGPLARASALHFASLHTLPRTSARHLCCCASSPAPVPFCLAFLSFLFPLAHPSSLLSISNLFFLLVNRTFK